MLSGCATVTSPSGQTDASRPDLGPKPDPSVRYVAIIGDSFTSGRQFKGADPDGWPSIVAIQLSTDGTKIRPDVAATGGSGYVKHGTRGSVPFDQQVRQVAGQNVDLVVLFGAAHDETALPDKADELSQAVQRTLAEARQSAPKAKLLVIGPASVEAQPSLDSAQVRDIVKAQADAVGVPFVDPLAELWFSGRPDLIGSDGALTRPGHAVAAEKIGPYISEQLGLAKTP